MIVVASYFLIGFMDVDTFSDSDPNISVYDADLAEPSQQGNASFCDENQCINYSCSNNFETAEKKVHSASKTFIGVSRHSRFYAQTEQTGKKEFTPNKSLGIFLHKYTVTRNLDGGHAMYTVTVESFDGMVEQSGLKQSDDELSASLVGESTQLSDGCESSDSGENFFARLRRRLKSL